MENGNRTDVQAVLVIAAAGFFSVIAQVVFLRTVLSLFGSNEFCLALFWFLWFTSNSAGIRSGSGAGSLRVDPSDILAYPTVVLLSYLLTLFLPVVLRTGDTGSNFFRLCLAVVPVVFLQNFMNGRIVAIWGRRLTGSGAAAARVFLVESLVFIPGSVLTIIYLPTFRDFHILFLGSLPLVLAGTLLEPVALNRRLVLKSVLVAVIIVMAAMEPWLEKKALKVVYPGYEPVKTVNTYEGRLDILAYGTERYAFFSGRPLVLENEPGADEEAVYTALCQTGSGPSVLVDGTVFTEILPKLRDVKCRKLVVLARDRTFFRTVRDILPVEVRQMLDSGKVVVVHKPLQEFLRGCGEKFDLVFLSLNGTGLLKDISPFFKSSLDLVKKHLDQNGICSVILPPEAARLSRPSALLEQGIHSGLRGVFPFTAVFLLNHHTVMLASDKRLITDIDGMLSSLRKKGVNPVYFTKYDTGTRMANAEAIGIADILRTGTGNSFDRPVSVAYGLIGFLSGFNLGAGNKFSDLFGAVQKLRPFWMTALGFLVLLSVVLIATRSERTAGALVSGAVFPAFQMLFIFLYQISYSDVFSKMGLVIGLFMAGVSLGLMADLRFRGWTGSLAVSVSGLVAFVMAMLSMALPEPLAPLCAGVFFSGAGQGMLFRMISEPSDMADPGNLHVYLMDLLGASAVNLSVPLLLIPFFGFRYLAWLCLTVLLAFLAVHTIRGFREG